MNARVDTTTDGKAVRQLAERIRGLRDGTLAEVARVVVGMEGVTHQFLIALLAAGHVLLEHHTERLASLTRSLPLIMTDPADGDPSAPTLGGPP